MQQDAKRFTISIAMATYNGARFLPEQLASFVAQERLPDELVVCDDGSTDATMEILHAFAATAPFTVRVERNETNIGYVRNFEKALSLCTGDLIFLSDQDDVWLSSKLLRVEAEFVANPTVMLVANDMIITDAALKHSNVTQLGNIRASGIGDERFAFGCSMGIRKDFLTLLFPLPAEHFSHDGWIADACRSLGVQEILEEPLQLYRRHGDNGSNSFLSDPKKVTAWTMISKLDVRSPVDGWNGQLTMISVKRNWVRVKQSQLEGLGLGDQARRLLLDLDFHEQVISDRIEMWRTPRLRRIPRVIKFFAAGRYRRFSGWKSAVKDMIRP